MSPLATTVLFGVLIWPALGTGCADDADVDLCDDEEMPTSGASRLSPSAPMALSLVLALSGHMQPSAAAAAWLVAALGSVPMASGASGPAGVSCGAVKEMYKDAGCCGQPDAAFDADYQIIPAPSKSVITSANPCVDTKPELYLGPNSGYENSNCSVDGVIVAAEQAGANVTAGYVGGMDTDATPWNQTYLEGGLCPVNVHWHYGAEHLSVGEFDEDGTGRNFSEEDDGAGRRLGVARLGFQCHYFDEDDPKFTTEYDWAYCVGMHVGETYEVHWPHSAAGACGTPFQYQTPFYDGVFCRGTSYLAGELQYKVGVQAQVFTIVNDDAYFYPDLMRGMIMDAEGGFGADIAYYTGSTTGTTRNNEMCSAYSPITWQVDRKCHLISASSFDKMCADMLQQKDDMTDDLHAHGARELVSDALAANNLQRL